MTDATADIQSLFSKDPLSYTREDTEAIVAHYRKQREQFKLAEKQGKTPKAPKKEAVKVDLDDLFKGAL